MNSHLLRFQNRGDDDLGEMVYTILYPHNLGIGWDRLVVAVGVVGDDVYVGQRLPCCSSEYK
jgi:hypothetical protein